MKLKRLVLPLVYFIVGYSVSSCFASEIVSCDGFETCPTDCTPVNHILALEATIEDQVNSIAELEARVAELEAEVIERTANLSGATMKAARLINVSLNYADMTSVNLTREFYDEGLYDVADLTDAKLRHANLTNADLSYANIFSADLSDSNLTDANLEQATLTGAILTDVIWSNTTCPDGSNSDTNGLNACEP